MKKFISMLLALVMVFSMAACGGNANKETDAPAAEPLTGTLEELLNQVMEQNPVEFMGGSIPVDVTDTSEDGLANLKYFTGLESAEGITEAAVYEPMMSAIAFSLIMVRVDETTDSAAVAEAMKAGVDPRKWVCVAADDMMAASYGDVVMLIMVASDSGLTAQSYVDAFQTVCSNQIASAEVQVH